MAIYRTTLPFVVFMMRTVSEFYLGKNTDLMTADQLKRDWRYVVDHSDMWDCETDDYLNRFGL